MPLFQHKRRKGALNYDPKTMTPAVRKSICTGEMTAGFIDQDGKFRDFMLIPDQKALEGFCDDVGVNVEDIRTIY